MAVLQITGGCFGHPTAYIFDQIFINVSACVTLYLVGISPSHQRALHFLQLAFFAFCSEGKMSTVEEVEKEVNYWDKG